MRSPQEVQRFGQKKIPGVGQVQEKGRFQERRWPPSLGTQHDYTKDDDYDDYDGVQQKSHKHFIPYMVFCASIWDSVRHHCHHHHDHHDHQK